MINYNTILSTFNDRGTLLQYLNFLRKALEQGSLTSITTISVDETHFKIRATFADGTYVDSQSIELIKGPKGDAGDDGEDGRSIISITKTATSGLVDTYTISYSDETTSTFNVTNGEQGEQGEQGETGNGIASITLVGKVGLIATYRITYTNGNTFNFTVSDGASGVPSKESLQAIIVGSDYISFDEGEGTQSGKLVIELDQTKVDTAVTEDSDNLITSGAVYDALADKQDVLTTPQMNAVNSGIDATKVAKMLLTPSSTPTSIEVVGVDESNAQTRIKLGLGLETSQTTSPFTFDVVGVKLLTTAPTSDNEDGDVKFVYLESEPQTRYSGYFYFVKKSG